MTAKTEQQTRKDLIDPALEKAGWSPKDRTKVVAEVDIPVPPIESQMKFCDLVHHSDRIRSRQETSAMEINELFHALMHKAFREELAAVKTTL